MEAKRPKESRKKRKEIFASAVFLSCIFINLQLPQGWRASLLLTFVS